MARSAEHERVSDLLGNRDLFMRLDLLIQAADVVKTVASGASIYANHYANACECARTPLLFLVMRVPNFPGLSGTNERA